MGAAQLQRLFQGLERSYGQYNPTNKTHSFIHQPLTLQQYKDHIEGKFSLGVIPIDENNEAQWGAIDIDEHKKDKKNIQPWTINDYKKLLDKIKFLKLPLNVFKSKSGGAHCILFLDKGHSAKVVQDIMRVFEYALGYEGLEIFPKQTELGPKDSGSYLNLPYFKGNSRTLINFDYKELNIEGLNYAIERIVRLPPLLKFFLLKQGGKKQHRNDRTWCAAAYFKKNFDDWENKVKEYNQLFNEPPLDQKELENTIFKSHTNKDYNDEQEEYSKEYSKRKKKNGFKETYDPTAWRQGMQAKDIQTKEYPPIEWVVEGLVGDGLTVFAGKSKIGKSFATLDLAYQVEIGGEWLGKKCAKGEVLYYALEDGATRCKNRWKVMDIKPKEAWYQFRDRRPKIPLLTMGLEDEIENWIDQTPNAKLVIIDVYIKVKKTIGGYKLNSYENDNFNLQNLQTLAISKGIAIVLVHHTKKAKEEDVFDEINGSAGIQSNADSMIVLVSNRKKGINPVLHCIPKDAEQQEFEIALNPKCIWEYVGKVGEAAKTKLQKAILDAIKKHEASTPDGAKSEIIKSEVQVNNENENWTKEHIQVEIDRLLNKSEIIKTKRGFYKHVPY